jgi:hypothetical protein
VSKITGKPEPKPKNQETGDPVPVPVLKSQKLGTPVPVPSFWYTVFTGILGTGKIIYIFIYLFYV